MSPAAGRRCTRCAPRARRATGPARRSASCARSAGCEILLLEAEIGQRGYLLTGQEAYLEPYEHALTAVRPALDALKRLVADTPSQEARLEQVESLSEAKLAELKQTIELRRTAGIDAAANVVNTHVGRGLMTRLLSILGEVEAEETALLNQRSDERAESFWWASRVALASSGLALIVVALVDPGGERGGAPAQRGGALAARERGTTAGDAAQHRRRGDRHRRAAGASSS